MKKIVLKNVGQDHLEAHAKFRNPLIAIEELVWNGLDADATRIDVSLAISDLGGLQQITVKDDGLGMTFADCEHAFSSLGNSKKLQQGTTPGGRMLHGKHGKGRFRAFGVGRSITWQSRYRDNGSVKQFSIRGFRSSLKSFEIGDEKTVRKSATGVEVTIEDIDSNFPSLTRAETAATELSRRLALYLKQYPGITIFYDDLRVDPTALQESIVTYPMTLKDKESKDVPAELTVIEWKIPTDRALYLCDDKGFALDEKNPGIQAPGFSFTAYLKSRLITELDQDNALGADQIHPVVDAMLNGTKDILRKHFREREA